MDRGLITHPLYGDSDHGTAWRIHPTKGWQFWGILTHGWFTAHQFRGARTIDKIVSWEETWAEPEVGFR